MRVVGVLLRNLIDDALDKDHMASVLKHSADNVKLLTEQIRSCGVTFSIWTDRTGNMDWTSLTGTDCIKLHENLSPVKIRVHFVYE